MGLKVLYEDNHIIAVLKVAGDLVQADKTEDETLADDKFIHTLKPNLFEAKFLAGIKNKYTFLLFRIAFLPLSVKLISFSGPSILFLIHAFSSGSLMCMNSYPIVEQ